MSCALARSRKPDSSSSFWSLCCLYWQCDHRGDLGFDPNATVKFYICFSTGYRRCVDGANPYFSDMTFKQQKINGQLQK